jgi:cytochrome c-type biogenesis protein CcmH
MTACGFALIVRLALAAAAPQGEASALSDVDAVVGAPRGAPLAGEALERETRAVSELLRCPVCQGLSVADSKATMAISMKNRARDLLARGYDPDQVLRYFDHSYGEFVRLKPQLRGSNWLVWTAPALALIVGIAIVLGVLHREGRRPVENVEPATDAELAPYVQRARALVSERAQNKGSARSNESGRNASH